MRNSSDGLPQTLRNIRNRQGLSAKEFASRAGVGRSTVSNAENGQQVSDEFLSKIIEAFPDAAADLGGYLDDRPPTRDAGAVSDRGDDVLFRRAQVASELAGTWYALWQTSVDDQEVHNVEALDVTWRRNQLRIRNLAISEQNPHGGYLWNAECRLYDNQYLLGYYIARDGVTRSKGSLYMILHTSGRSILGHWVGCNYDSDWAHGLVAISRVEDNLDRLLAKFIATQPRMPYN